MFFEFMKLSLMQPSFANYVNRFPSFFILTRLCRFNLQLPEFKSVRFRSFEVSSDRETKFSTLLLNYGFSNGQVRRILNSKYCIMGLDEKDLSSNLENWYMFDANDKIFTILTGNPELLSLNPEYVKFRYTELMSLFTKKDIHKLLLTCPMVFLEDIEIIKSKMQYIVHCMAVEQKSIVKCEALKYDLDYIKRRHLFMKFAGLYKIYKKTKSKNPPLNKILTRNVTNYLKLSKLAHDEYDAFCECCIETDLLENFEDLDSSEDSDDEV